MNSYQAIEATDIAQNTSERFDLPLPAEALSQADDTWSRSLLWNPNSCDTDQAVLIDGFGSGAPFFSLLRLWHETRSNHHSENSANLQPRLQVYALALKPWTSESLKAYWHNAVLPSEKPSKSSIDEDLRNSFDLEVLAWLIDHWPAATPGLHCIDFQKWGCTLWLWFGDRERGLTQLSGSLDAFWPKAGLLGQQGRGLSSNELTNQSSNQSSNKWSNKAQRHLDLLLQPKTKHPPRMMTVAIVGAGIAGSCTAKALCDQGFEVHLLDAEDGPAAGASGNWVGAFHPHITRDDTPLSQLTRLGCEFSLQALDNLTQLGLLVKGVDWDTPGHLQTIPTDEVQRTRDTLAQLQFPDSVVQWAEPFTRMETHLHGLFFPQGAWVKPARWVEANLQACGPRLKTHYACKIEDLSELYTRLGANVNAVVVACAQESFSVTKLNPGKSNSVKGQITRVQKGVQATNGINNDAMPHVASGESYAIDPPAEHWMLLGATYERPVGDLMPTEASDALNIARFQTAFRSFELGPYLDSRCAVRFVWPDRLPVVGAVVDPVGASEHAKPEAPTVYLNTAYASRGLTWAAMAAHLIAMQVRKHPLGSGQSIHFKLTDRLLPRHSSK